VTSKSTHPKVGNETHLHPILTIENSGPKRQAMNSALSIPDQMALWSESQLLIATSKRLCSKLQASRRRCPVRRLQRLGAGANDAESPVIALPAGPETRCRRCPSCQSELVEPLGRITAVNGVLLVPLRCRCCHCFFTFIREPRTFGGLPRVAAAVPPPAP